VVVPVGEASRLVAGLTAGGRRLGVLVRESDPGDDVRDVVAVREVTAAEVGQVLIAQRTDDDEPEPPRPG
jgi:hypothetical protein